MNQVALIGRITKDPELKTFAGGAVQTGFVLAVEKKFKDNEADFVLCSIWGKSAESTVEYCGKGSLISVCGRLQSRSYVKNGERVYVTEVLCEELKFLQLKPPAGSLEKQAEELLSASAQAGDEGNPGPDPGQDQHPAPAGEHADGGQTAPDGPDAGRQPDGYTQPHPTQNTRGHHVQADGNGAPGGQPRPASDRERETVAAGVSGAPPAQRTGPLPDGLTLPDSETAGLPIRP